MLIASKLLPLFFYPLTICLFCMLFVLIFTSTNRLAKLALITGILSIAVGGNRLFSDWLIWSLERDYRRPQIEQLSGDVAIVLGGATQPVRRHRRTAEVNDAGDRLIMAADLYNLGTVPKILITGGRTSSSIPESVTMARILMKLGVPQEDILLEKEALNTEQNVGFAKEIIEEHGFEQVVLVTSAFHMRRASLQFQAQGIEHLPVATDFRMNTLRFFWLTDIFPEAKNLSKTTRAIKEYLGYWLLKARGY